MSGIGIKSKKALPAYDLESSVHCPTTREYLSCKPCHPNHYLSKAVTPPSLLKMVKFTTTLLGLAALAAAAPAPQASSLEAREDAFSFQAWIDEIVASPEAEHMSAEDAYKAAQKSHHKRSEASTHPDVLFKRDVSCNEKEVASVSISPECSAQLR